MPEQQEGQQPSGGMPPGASGFQMIEIPFPMKGIDVGGPLSQQPEGTTPDCLNVWPLESTGERMRGGARCGVTRLTTNSLNGQNPLQCVHQSASSKTGIASQSLSQTINSSSSSGTTGTGGLTFSSGTIPDYAMTGDGVMVVPGPGGAGAAFSMVRSNTGNTAGSVTAYSTGQALANGYLGSVWLQNGRCYIFYVKFGAATRVCYEIRDKDGSQVLSRTDLYTKGDSSSKYFYGVCATETHVFIWANFAGNGIPGGGTFPAGEGVVKLKIGATGALTATGNASDAGGQTWALRKATATGSGLNLVNGLMRVGASTDAEGPTNGGMCLLRDRLVLAENSSYSTPDDTKFRSVKLQAYDLVSGVALDSQLLNLPAVSYTSSGSRVKINCRQLVSTADQSNGTRILSLLANDLPGASDTFDVVSAFQASTSVSASTTMQSTTKTNSSGELAFVDSSSETYTSIAYNGLTNRVLVVRRRNAAGSGFTATQFSMGGSVDKQAAPLGGMSLEWCGAAPWGWLVAGYASSGDCIAALDFNLNTLWTTSAVTFASASLVNKLSTNYSRLFSYAANTTPSSAAKGFVYTMPDAAATATVSVSEGAVKSVSVRLQKAPTSGQTAVATFTTGDAATVLLSTDGTTTGSSKSLTFNATNFATAQTLFIHGVADALVESPASVTVTASSSSSGDSEYAAITPPAITVNVSDATAGYLFSATSFSVYEGSTTTIKLRLNTAPTASVTVSFASSDTNKATVTASRIFTTSNWMTEQDVVVTGVAGSITGADQTITITTTQSSADGTYNGINPSDLTVLVKDVKSPTTRVFYNLAVASGGVYDVKASPPLLQAGGTLSTVGVVRAASLGYLTFFADGSSALYHDGESASIKTLTPTKGVLPSVAGFRPQCVETWRDRVVFFAIKSDPQNWFMCRRFVFTDWEYQRDGDLNSPQDSDRAIHGTFSAAGVFPDIMNGFIPYNYDLAIIGGDSSMYQLSGDPAAGAVFDNIPTVSGMAFGRAWCLDTLGQIYYFGRRGGLYRLRLNAPVQRVSSKRIESLMATSMDEVTVTMQWDDEREGVHIFIVPMSSGVTAQWWFYDAATDGFFEMDFTDAAMFPLSTCVFDGDAAEDRYLVLGGRDGVPRKLDTSATADDGQVIDSYVTVGPLLGGFGQVQANRMQFDTTGSPLVGVLVGETPESALAATEIPLARGSGNMQLRKRVRGRSMWFQLSKPSGAWSMDRIAVEVRMIAR